MKWHFPVLSLDQVETEVTQRDQFDNDDVELSETIVREAVQNSLDAALDESSQVRVTFRFYDKYDGLDAGFLCRCLEGQEPHAQTAGLDTNRLDYSNPRVLVIEDFGTKGLTGQIDAKDDDNFSDFWRRHGKSHKTGKSRGRWGLGKLVYSCSSLTGVFFGVTRRESESQDYLLGQTVLNLREMDGTHYAPHGFWCELKSEGDPSKQLPIPCTDVTFVDEFITKFALERKTGSGLSIVIPFPSDKFNTDRMIGIAIANYFYPVITKKLVLVIDDVVIDSSSIRQLAHQYASKHFDQIEVLFDFIEGASKMDPASLLKMRESWSDDSKLGADDFEVEVLEKIREKFVAGETVALYLPISLTKKNSESIKTSFSVFIKRPPELQKGLDLYVRGGLTLPAEEKFRERRALGVLVAEEEPICAFLGDAENAAHTLWTTNTEKLRRNYRSSQAPVTVIKKALVQLYDLLAEVTEEKDKDALTNFFWFEEPEREGRKKSRSPNPLGPPLLPKKAPRFRVHAIKGGFVVESGDGLSEQDLPQSFKVKAAYEVSRGNAFERWSRHDFDFGRHDSIVASGGAELTSRQGQEITFEVTALPFRLSVSEFDENRDLKVRVS